MKIGETIQVAFGSLRANRLRSALTVLGIVIGIFSIISVSTVIAMLQRSIEDGVSDLSKNTFQVQKWPAIHTGRISEKIWNRQDITIDHFNQLRARLPEAKYMAAQMWRGGQKVKSEWVSTNPNISIGGITPEAVPTSAWEIGEGRNINQNDLDYATKVCLLGDELAQKLFKSINPIGQEVRVAGMRLKVVGVFAPRGQLFGESRDNFMAVPLTTFQNEYGKYRRSIDIVIMSHGKQDYNDTIEATIGALRAIRRVPANEDNDFEIVSNESLISQLNSMTQGIKVGSVVVALIALLAAGVGIMNIMLVSVTERTREIGIRKALGAKRRTILLQFLIEAITLCQFGGIIGIIFGVLTGNLVGMQLNAPPIFPMDWIIAGIMMCVFVGVIFGTGPAYKAARLDPIEALRYE